MHIYVETGAAAAGAVTKLSIQVPKALMAIKSIGKVKLRTETFIHPFGFNIN